MKAVILDPEAAVVTTTIWQRRTRLAASLFTPPRPVNLKLRLLDD